MPHLVNLLRDYVWIIHAAILSGVRDRVIREAMSDPAFPWRLLMLAGLAFIAAQIVRIRERVDIGFRDVVTVLVQIRGPLK